MQVFQNRGSWVKVFILPLVNRKFLQFFATLFKCIVIARDILLNIILFLLSQCLIRLSRTGVHWYVFTCQNLTPFKVKSHILGVNYPEERVLQFLWLEVHTVHRSAGSSLMNHALEMTLIIFLQCMVAISYMINYCLFF